MTTYSLPATSQPSSRPAVPASSRFGSHRSACIAKAAPRSVPNYSLFDLKCTSPTDPIEPPSKRRRLCQDEHNGTQPPASPAHQATTQDTCSQALPLTSRSPIANAAITPIFTASIDSPISRPPFPARPGRLFRSARTYNSELTGNTQKEDVQIKAYRIDVPRMAPQLENHGITSSQFGARTSTCL